MTPNTTPVLTFYAGLDLGKLSDFSAFVVIEVVSPTRFELRHAQRWPLGTPYPVIVADLKTIYSKRPPGGLGGSVLVIDGTGVGEPVVDMVKLAGLDAQVESFIITGGYRTTEGTVPKQHLVGAVQVALGNRLLHVSPHLELAALIQQELTNFRLKVHEETRSVEYAAGREGEHDDLVLATALPLWWILMRGGGSQCYGGPDPNRQPFDGLGPGTWTPQPRE